MIYVKINSLYLFKLITLIGNPRDLNESIYAMVDLYD